LRRRAKPIFCCRHMCSFLKDVCNLIHQHFNRCPTSLYLLPNHSRSLDQFVALPASEGELKGRIKGELKGTGVAL
jgi:hypothetical protein